MNKTRILLITSTLFFMIFTNGAMSFPLGGKEMVRSGSGARTKTFIGTVYYASLFLPQELKGKSGKEIIEAEQPMSIIIQIDSRLITRDRFIDAVKEGFGNSAKSGYTSDKKDSFLKTFNSLEFSKGDVFNLNYVPKSGVTVVYTSIKTGKTQAMVTTPGLDLKKALFAIWLGQYCAQDSLRKGMLGN